MADFQDRGDAARAAAGIDGTAGDAQDKHHAYVPDSPHTWCLLCGLGDDARVHQRHGAAVTDPIIDLTEAEWQHALDTALAELGCTWGELCAMADNDTWATPRHRSLWAGIGGHGARPREMS